MSRHVRRRYDRMAALLLSTGVTVVSVLAGLGVVGETSTSGAAAGAPQQASSPVHATLSTRTARQADRAAEATRLQTTSTSSSVTRAASRTGVPAGSGEGKRIVFDMSAQRVWLVDGRGRVETSYLVSGSVTHNLNPGLYAVYSRSRYAVGVDDSGDMQFFVRFTRGNSAAIGFHDIPTQGGLPLQTLSQLGTPQSHGCIRQARPDAIRLWDFAPVGTHVDVVA